MRKDSEEISRGNSDTNLVLITFFPENRAIYEEMYKYIVEPKQATDANMAHAQCMLDT
jgi:hypothetical protein